MSSAALQAPQLTADEALALSIYDPVAFSEQWNNSTLWWKQCEILHDIEKHRKLAVKACHASSKTYTAALATLWWLARHKESLVITTAPTQNQVEKILWTEIRRIIAQSKYPWPKPNLSQLTLEPGRSAIGFTTSVEQGDAGVKLHGFHSKNILIILDEAPGVEGILWDAIEGILSAGNTHLLALGNPVISSGPFYDAFGANKQTWKTHTISAFDTPNMKGLTIEDLMQMTDAELDYSPVNYLISRRWVRDRYMEWGDKHPHYVSKVLGNFPSNDPQSMFALSWLDEAQKKEVSNTYTKFEAGIDVAGPGEDETVLYVRSGKDIVLFKAWPDPDPRGEIVKLLRPFKGKIEVRVDVAGIGYYLARYLEDAGFLVSDVNAGSSPLDREKYSNLKAELYWSLRMRFEDGDMAGLKDDATFAQLSSIRYKINSRGQIEIETKENARKRGVHSPDRAEALMLAFAPSFQHGLFSIVEEQAKDIELEIQTAKSKQMNAHINNVINNDTTPKCIATELAAAQKEQSGFSMFSKSNKDSLQISSPKSLGKVVTSNSTPGCTNCGNKILSLYGDGAWKCGACGQSGVVNNSVLTHY